MSVRRTAAGAVEVAAPAKLNLFLEVTGKRPDGYHEIETLMVALDLADNLTCSLDPSGRITLACDDPTLPTGAENLVVKAAEALRAAVGRPELGASIALRKAIPAQAGLAGGSSDGAAALRALDVLWDLHASETTLHDCAAAIGSDVAFFLQVEAGSEHCAAICRGRGEIVEPLSLNHALHFVLVMPPVGVGTAEVYRNLTPPDRVRAVGPAAAALTGSDPAALGRSLFNRLQPTAEALVPALTRVRDALTAEGAALDGALMSGSGSAYFGLARDRDAAAGVAQRLETLGLGRVRVVTCGPGSSWAENAS